MFAVLVALSIVLLTAYFGEGPGGAAARLPARRAGGPRADRDGRLARDQAVPRPGRLGRRQPRRQGRERGAEEGERRPARAGRARAGGRGRERASCASTPACRRSRATRTARSSRRARDRLSPTVWNSRRPDRQGLDRRHARQPAGDRRRRPGRQGHAGHRRQRGRHADHRRLERGVAPRCCPTATRRRPGPGRRTRRHARSSTSKEQQGREGRHGRSRPGSTSEKLESLFPKGIPIGRVKRVEQDELECTARCRSSRSPTSGASSSCRCCAQSRKPDTEPVPNGTGNRGRDP